LFLCLKCEFEGQTPHLFVFFPVIRDFSKTLGIAPKKEADEGPLETSIALMRSPTYFLLALSGFFTVLGYFVPSGFLTDKAEVELSIPRDKAQYLPVAIGAANTVGRVVFGILANSERARYSLAVTNGALVVGGTATILTIWATSYVHLLLYALLFGLVLGKKSPVH
jgi:predicted MFS family arabinose efflux permease